MLTLRSTWASGVDILDRKSGASQTRFPDIDAHSAFRGVVIVAVVVVDTVADVDDPVLVEVAVIVVLVSVAVVVVLVVVVAKQSDARWDLSSL